MDDAMVYENQTFDDFENFTDHDEEAGKDEDLESWYGTSKRNIADNSPKLGEDRSGASDCSLSRSTSGHISRATRPYRTSSNTSKSTARLESKQYTPNSVVYEESAVRHMHSVTDMHSDADETIANKQSQLKSRHLKGRKAFINMKGVARRRGKDTASSDATQTNLANTKKSVVVDRVLSANRHKARALRNVISELQAEIEQLKIENRDLKKVNRLQDREINKLDSAEAELPFLLKKHSNEMRVLTDKYKRQREETEKARGELKRREQELARAKVKLQQLEDVVNAGNLSERSALNKKLAEMEEELLGKQEKIEELTKAIALHEKAHNRDVKQINEKYKKVSAEMKQLENEQKELVSKLKRKEKALEVTNIYSKKMLQQPKFDETASSGFRLFSPRDPMPYTLKKALSLDDEESGQDGVFITEKFRDASVQSVICESSPQINMAKKSRGKDIASGTDVQQINRNYSHGVSNDDSMSMVTASDTSRNDSRGNAPGRPVKASRKDVVISGSPLTVDNGAKSSLNDILSGEEGEREAQRVAVASVPNKPSDFGNQEQTRKPLLSTICTEPLVDLQESFKHVHDKLNFQNGKSLDGERMDDSRQLIEHKIAGSEGTRMEARQKKDLLLAKLKAIDQGADPNLVAESKFEANHASHNSKSEREKPVFLRTVDPGPKHADKNASDRGHSEELTAHNVPIFSSEDPPSDRNRRRLSRMQQNSWTFRQPDENLHKGLPSHPDIVDSPQRGDHGSANVIFSDISFGVYQPTFTQSEGWRRRVSNGTDGSSSSNFSSKNVNPSSLRSVERPAMTDFGNSTALSTASGNKNLKATEISSNAELNTYSSRPHPINANGGIVLSKKSPFDEFEDPFEDKGNVWSAAGSATPSRQPLSTIHADVDTGNLLKPAEADRGVSRTPYSRKNKLSLQAGYMPSKVGYNLDADVEELLLT